MNPEFDENDDIIPEQKSIFTHKATAAPSGPHESGKARQACVCTPRSTHCSLVSDNVRTFLTWWETLMHEILTWPSFSIAMFCEPTKTLGQNHLSTKQSGWSHDCKMELQNRTHHLWVSLGWLDQSPWSAYSTKISVSQPRLTQRWWFLKQTQAEGSFQNCVIFFQAKKNPQ